MKVQSIKHEKDPDMKSARQQLEDHWLDRDSWMDIRVNIGEALQAVITKHVIDSCINIILTTREVHKDREPTAPGQASCWVAVHKHLTTNLGFQKRDWQMLRRIYNVSCSRVDRGQPSVEVFACS